MNEWLWQHIPTSTYKFTWIGWQEPDNFRRRA